MQWIGEKKGLKKCLMIIGLAFGVTISQGLYGGEASASTSLQTPPNSYPKSTGNFTSKLERSGDYKEAINTFWEKDINGNDTGEVTYYLITTDKDKKELGEVTYKGKKYSIKEVLVGDRLDLLRVTGDDYPIADYRATGNRTFFIDDGTYTDGKLANYGSLSIENRSMVGLNKNAKGEPAAIITKAAYPADYLVEAARDCIERYNIEKKNVYFENLIFDGTGKDLLPLGGISGLEKNQGEHLFSLTGGNYPWDASEGFVMRDIIIQNVGADTAQTGSLQSAALVRKNVAINFYKSRGQHNIEDVIIRSVKTKEGISGAGFGIISFNQTKENYLKNITIVGDGAHSSSRSVKVENMATDVMPVSGNHVVFSGELNLPQALYENNYNNHIYVQDYQYKEVIVPESFKHVRWSGPNRINANAFFSIYKSRPIFDSSHAVHDFQDDYWVTDASIKPSFFMTIQLNTINSVMNYTPSVAGTAYGYRSPRSYIKIASNEVDIPGFTVPSYVSPGIYIVAVPQVGDTTSPYTSTELIPFAENGTIKGLPEPGTKEAKLYNFDFHVNANYTLHEATKGIDPAAVILTDPVEGNALPAYLSGYPLYSTYKPSDIVNPKVVASTPDTFVNCRFTVLAKTLTGNTTRTIQVGSPVSLGVAVGAGYTGPDPWNTRPATEVDDPSIAYYSSDTSIATVGADGTITGVAPGTVKIYAKAKDQYNNGEIEKPYLMIEVTVQQKYTLTYDGNGNEEGTVPGSVTENSGTEVTVAGNTGTLTKTGYEFAGWNTAADGSGTAYPGGSSIAIQEPTTLYAQWTKINDVVLHYDGNGSSSGNAPGDQSVQPGGNLTTADQNTLTREGYTFAGWNTAADGSGTAYQPGDSIPMEGNTTLYAQWEPILVKDYILSYEGNGNTAGTKPADQTGVPGSNLPAAVPGTLVKEGYTFAGWNTNPDGSGTAYQPGDSIPMEGNTTLYAQWKKNEETKTIGLIYNGNGHTAGTVPIGVTVTTPGAITIKEPGSMAQEGSAFKGWNTKADGSGTWYYPGDSFFLKVDTVLYAQWKSVTPENKIHLFYDANGGFGPTPSGVTLNKLGDVLVDDRGGLYKAGYDFVGWNTKADGSGTWCYPGDPLFLSRDTVLYAQWKKVTVPSVGGSIGGYPDYSAVLKGKVETPGDTLEKPQKPETDLVLDKENHFAYLDGYPDVTVRPQRFVTRGEVATIFSKLTVNKEDIDSFDGITTFGDVRSEDWYARYIRFITDHKVMVGYPDGTFQPNAPITRAEFAAVVSKFEQLSNGAAPFGDIQSHWAENYIRSAYTKGWVSGYPDGTFKPQGNITRAEAAAIINQMLERQVDKQGIGQLHITWFNDLKPSNWSFYHMIEASNTHLYTRRMPGAPMEDWTEVKRHRAPRTFVPLANYGVE